MLLTVVDVQSGIRLTSFARKVAKNRPWSGFDSSLRSLRISVISALNISRDYSNAEITEIRRDRREEANSCIKHFSCKATQIGFAQIDPDMYVKANEIRRVMKAGSSNHGNPWPSHASKSRLVGLRGVFHPGAHSRVKSSTDLL